MKARCLRGPALEFVEAGRLNFERRPVRVEFKSSQQREAFENEIAIAHFIRENCSQLRIRWRKIYRIGDI